MATDHNIAYIIGNGPSRKGLDLDTLDGTIFGCNALYRDYPADYLVSGDSTIIKEITIFRKVPMHFINSISHHL